MGPTAYPEINSMLETLRAGTEQILRGNFLGMYLFGSLASGDFSAETSDIDFVVVTQADIRAEARAELGQLNARIQAAAPQWAAKLEGSFLPLHVFKDFNPSYTIHPSISMGGKYGLGHKGIEHAIQRFMLREDGIALSGPVPKAFIDPVTPEELKAAAVDLLRRGWEPKLRDSSRMKRRGYQAYAVLTMCRILYTLDTGGVASKPFAGRWACDRLDEHWRELVDRALAWKEDDGVDDLGQTVALIRYTLGQVQVDGGSNCPDARSTPPIAF